MHKKIIFILLTLISLNSCGQRLAHDQNFLIPSNVSNNDYVGKLLINANWDTVYSIDYALHEDTSGIFSISNGNLIISDNTDLQASVTYRVTFQVQDGKIIDNAFAYIYVVDSDSCRFIDLDGGESAEDIDNSMNADTVYLFKRGTRDTIDSEVNVNAAVTIGAYGQGDIPYIFSNMTYGSEDDAIFDVEASEATIRDLKLATSTLRRVILVVGLDNTIIDNCEITETDSESNSFGITLNNTTDSKIINCKICNTGDDAIILSGEHYDDEIAYNILYNLGTHYSGGSGYGDCVQCYSATDNIDDTHIHHNYCNKLADTTGKQCFIIESNSSDDDITIEYNRCLCENTITRPIIFSSVFDTIILTGNYIQGGKDKQIGFDGASNYVKLVQNIFVEPDGNILEDWISTGDSLILFNNIFYKPTNHCVWIANSNGGRLLRNNIFHLGTETNNIVYADPGTNLNMNYSLCWPDTTGKFSSNLSTGINSIIGNPNFVDTVNYNFHLKSTSPAIDAGIAVGLTRDIKNYIIPQGDAQDIGAYERIVDKVLKFPGSRDMWLRFPGNRKFVIKK